MLVPAEIRKKMDPQRDGEAFYMVLGRNRQPWLYCERFYEELVSHQRPPELLPNDDELAYDQLVFGMASRLEMDKQGRVLIPQKMRQRTGLGDQITLVGVKDHAELWNRDAWEARFNGLFERQGEVAARAREGRTPATHPPVRGD
jgi:MraZ protein